MFSPRLAGLILGCLMFQAVLVRCDGRENYTRLIIVGGGVSGIAAASRLTEKGFSDFKILEAENRIGGSIHSVQLGDGVLLDLGTESVEGGSENPIYELIKDVVEDIGEYVEPLSIFSDGETRNVPVDLSNLDLDSRHNVSFKDVLLEKSREVTNGTLDGEKLDAYMEHSAKVQCTYEGCDDLSDVSAHLYHDYHEFNNTRSYGFKGKGSKLIIDALLRKLPNSKGTPVELGNRLLLNTEVKRIKVLDSGEVEVECSDGGVHRADVVLVTASVGVLKNGLEFLPPLPALKHDAIKAAGFGTVDKIIIRFPTSWWPANSTGFECIWLKKDRDNYKGEYSWETEILEFGVDKASPYVLIAWLIGEPARQMERTPLEGVQRASLRVLRYFLGANYTIPEPVEVVRSTWGTNPHFRGSYSYRSIESERHNISHIETPLVNNRGKEVVLFAGEVTSPHYFSTVHGSVETGWREAERILGLFPAQ